MDCNNGRELIMANNYGRVKGSQEPQKITVTSDYVFVATNIQPYEKTIDDKIFSGYEYDYTRYTKDEYIQLMAENSDKISELADQLEATKILLGVE